MFTKRHYQVIATAIHASKIRTAMMLEEILVQKFLDDDPNGDRFLVDGPESAKLELGSF